MKNRFGYNPNTIKTKYQDNFNVERVDDKYKIVGKHGSTCSPLEICNAVGADVYEFSNYLRTVYGATIDDEYSSFSGRLSFKKERNAKRAVEYIQGLEIAKKLMDSSMGGGMFGDAASPW